MQQGAGQPHVYPNDLEKIKIPIVPLEKQQEIVNHVRAIRHKAIQLQHEANEILAQAKRQIEKEILGETL